MRSRNNGKKNGNGRTSAAQEETCTIRCAIYCRKSTEEGLQQDFNSLDAQREACEAYINSQRQEGWEVIPDQYNDGGYTGANTDRPALQQLLTDIENGKIEAVVTYKIDRISRSLLDFACLMDTFEKQNVSLVSITQQFSTANSMGRLTLNMLMSFAAFERDMIAERTRDKMSAARRRGKWLGGIPVLGYTVQKEPIRKLVILPNEAAMVGEIFRLYIEFHSLIDVADDINARGWRTKEWTAKNGKRTGGKLFDKNMISRIVNDVTYLGKVNYKNEIFEGEHEAIIDKDTFRNAQEILRTNQVTYGTHQRNRHGALLRGILYCDNCDRNMTHTFSRKGEKIYRYYTCTVAQKRGYSKCPTKSIPADEIENFVVQQVRKIGSSPDLHNLVSRQIQEIVEMKENSLATELEMTTTQIRGRNKEIRGLVKALAGEKNKSTSITDRIMELEEQIRQLEKREREVRQQLECVRNQKVTEQDIEKAIELFDPIWEVLLSRERERIIRLLIEKITYNGKTGQLDIRFNPTGIKLLASEYQTTGG